MVPKTMNSPIHFGWDLESREQARLHRDCCVKSCVRAWYTARIVVTWADVGVVAECCLVRADWSLIRH